MPDVCWPRFFDQAVKTINPEKTNKNRIIVHFQAGCAVFISMNQKLTPINLIAANIINSMAKFLPENQSSEAKKATVVRAISKIHTMVKVPFPILFLSSI